MEVNATRNATETREDDTGSVVEMRDNGDSRKGQWKGQHRTSTVAEMRDNRYGYGSGEDAELKQKI